MIARMNSHLMVKPSPKKMQTDAAGFAEDRYPSGGAKRRLQICERGTEREMPDCFAHPAERALAGEFDRLGIEWEYEPRTFVLERRNGRVVEACTPDFYLPHLDVYLECTVQQQK